MSFNVLVIAEDPTYNGAILKPMVLYSSLFRRI